MNQVLKRVSILVLSLIVLLLVWFTGYRSGMDHVIYNAELFIVDLPEVGDDWFTVYVEIDDQTHEYEGFIG